MADKVMRPKQTTRPPATTRQAKSGIIEGPTAQGSDNNLNPFSRTVKK